jgi:hypothetical protein
MNILSYADVKKYLQNKQVYFRKSIETVEFKTFAKENKVYTISKVEVQRLSDSTIAFTININGKETTLYEYKTDLEFFAFIKVNFIPVIYLLDAYLSR